MNTSARQIVSYSIPAICIASVVYLLAFNVGNTDFWWHIKAGQIMRDSGWISTDPFAYTRAGEAYLASHAWLAEIIQSLIYDVAGWQGITVLRILLVSIAFGLPLLLFRHNSSVLAPLAVLATVGARPALTDRPQLFTFVFFSITAVACLAYLDANTQKRKRILLSFPLVIALWTNMHGAASVTGLALIGALFIDQFLRKSSHVSLLFVSLLLSCGALLCTPNGVSNIAYLLSLSSDQSAELIAEWMPSPWSRYLLHTGLLWVASLVTLVVQRRHLVFSVLALLGIGYLSRTAARHEALFLLISLGVIGMQCKTVRLKIPYVVTLLSLVLVGGWAVVQAHRHTVRDNTFGFGEYSPMSGAAQFIHTQESGSVFNSYNAGGELLYHGVPVFLDGRNIDYGYEYIQRALTAGTDPVAWHELEAEYGFRYAVIFYPPEMHLRPVPYIDLLQQDPEWSLVYLDDFAAVYKKHADGYTVLTPQMLYTMHIPSEITVGDLHILEQEVLRVGTQKSAAYQAALMEAFGQ